jgi:hypothetical protein
MAETKLAAHQQCRQAQDHLHTEQKPQLLRFRQLLQGARWRGPAWSLTFFKPFPECVRRALGRILDPDTPHYEITTAFDLLT